MTRIQRTQGFCRLATLLVVLGVAVRVAGAVTVATPTGPAEVFARGELIDAAELLRLTGASVTFSPAAGSYVAVSSGHQVQFTPGGSLAVIDGTLVPLPGPVRALEGHVVTTPSAAVALLAPFGWTLRGTAAAPQLVQVGAQAAIEVSVVDSPSGTLVVLRGVTETPRLASVPGLVTLQFRQPPAVRQPVALQGGLTGVDVQGTQLRLQLAPGLEVASSYALQDPPRFVLRLAPVRTETPVTAETTGPIVVLDPGHGGEDQGAKGPNGELEKDIALAVARMTAARLQTAGVTARLTRDGDDTVALVDRTALANRLHADVFVSIHVNASPARGARGAETYFMSADASDVQAAQAAERENAGQRTDAVKLILWDLAYVANLNASDRLARTLQEHLNALHGLADRGVKQAPFVVLTGATMPAALVEIGFLSNPDEAARLTSRDTQEQIATALADAIVSYIRTPVPTPTPLAGPQ